MVSCIEKFAKNGWEMKKFALIGMMIAGTALSACSHTPTPKNIGMPNPASQYCLEQGGKLNIVKDAQGGEVGMCALPNGTTVEEWSFFRQNHTEMK